ncbi:hypothetical protein [Sphingobacterium sp.]|uniref:hypothetical protein n=1 Tax=Sphingobacterium sp. TaxID=341027 RepID=UPI00289FD6C4|nr:hypothetical protein [Sphingobacterium sp.]
MNWSLGNDKKWDCIPNNKLISVTIYYQRGEKDVCSAIIRADVLLREEKGMIIFFTEVRRDRVAMKPMR